MVTSEELDKLRDRYEKARRALPAYKAYQIAKIHLNDAASVLPEFVEFKKAYEVRGKAFTYERQTDLPEGKVLEEIEKAQRQCKKELEELNAKLEEEYGLRFYLEKATEIRYAISKEIEESELKTRENMLWRMRVDAQLAYDKAVVAKFLKGVEETK